MRLRKLADFTEKCPNGVAWQIGELELRSISLFSESAYLPWLLPAASGGGRSLHRPTTARRAAPKKSASFPFRFSSGRPDEWLPPHLNGHLHRPATCTAHRAAAKTQPLALCCWCGQIIVINLIPIIRLIQFLFFPLAACAHHALKCFRRERSS